MTMNTFHEEIKRNEKQKKFINYVESFRDEEYVQN